MRNIISYLFIFAIIYLFSQFLDITSGYFVLSIFITALILSNLTHRCAVELFKGHLGDGEDITLFADKGDMVTSELTYNKTVMIFLPTIFAVRFAVSHHLSPQNEEDLTWSFNMGRRPVRKELVLKFRHFGKAELRVDSVQAYDLLGIMSAFKRFRELPPHKFTGKYVYAIYPTVYDISPSSEFVRTLNDSSSSEDSEQSREVPFAVSGFPGYEHRDYVPGDSLKSINWKLSAKRDCLLVRKPEAYAGGEQVIVIARQPYSDDAESITHRQLAVEAALSLARAFMKLEMRCKLFAYIDGGFICTEIQGEDNIEQLKLKYATSDVDFGNKVQLPDLAGDTASGYIIFAAVADDKLYAATLDLRQRGKVPEIVSPVSGMTNNWLVTVTDGELVFTPD